MPKSRTSHLFGIGKPWKTEALRLLRGPFTTAELASILHVGATNIVKWENGSIRPTMSNLRALLKHYQAWTIDLAGAPMDWLIKAGAPIKGGKPWRKRESTNSRPATLTGSAKQASGSSAEAPA